MDKVKDLTSGVNLFNSPLEVALRLLFVFNSTNRNSDLQRLIYYNYLIIHSADIPNAPTSIHPSLPLRSCEMLVNRNVVKKALNILISRDLIKISYSKKGIEYSKNKSTELFLNYFESTYAKQLRERADWLSSEFDKLSDKQLTQFMDQNLGKWGSEFSANMPVLEDVYV